MPADAGLHAAWQRWLPGEATEVMARYREPHRRYHGVGHLTAVVRDVEAGLALAPVTDPAAVVAAAFFHDAVYDPRSATNEADSALYARGVLGAAWPPERVEEVARLVLVTATHQAADDDLAAAVLLDADLAILGAGPAAYEAYRRGVRAEFAHVDDEAWRQGRADVLRSFLSRAAIYRTTTGRALDARARVNLTAELATLGATN